MLGLAALASALTAALAQPPGLLSRPGAVLLVRPPLVHALALPAGRRAEPRACSTQPAVGERKLLPVACEQPPRSSVSLPNVASGGLSSLLGGR